MSISAAGAGRLPDLGGYGPAVPEPAVKRTKSESAIAATMDDRRSRDKPAEAAAPAPKPAGPSQHQRGAVAAARLRHADLAGRYTMGQLRRMNRAAFGAAAASTLPQQAAELKAEMTAEVSGERAPSAETHEDDDSLRRYIVLREALDQLQSEPGQERLRERLEKSVDALLAQHASRIVGELNISRVLERLHDDVAERDKLRTLYHDAVTDVSVAQTYDALLKAFGHERLPDALKSLRHAIHEDMQAPFASADPKHLATLVMDLQRVTRINSLYVSATVLFKLFPTLARQRVRAGFTGRLLRLVTDGGTAADVNTLCEWLDGAADTDEDAALPPLPRKPALHDAQRQASLRRFLHDQVPVDLWKGNARAAVTAHA